MTTIHYLDGAAIQANAEANLRVRLNNFPACKAELARELAALEARAPKSAEKRIEWAARVAASGPCWHDLPCLSP